MITKMNKTEISAKILKRKKIKVLIIGITPKQISTINHKTNPGSGSGSRERHRILAAILDFAEGAEKRKKKIIGQFLRANMHTANI